MDIYYCYTFLSDSDSSRSGTTNLYTVSIDRFYKFWHLIQVPQTAVYLSSEKKFHCIH